MPELRCHECNRFVHSEQFSDKILIGDAFYIYRCPSCYSGGEYFERLPISWSNLIQLVLYHLWMGGERKHRYFRWREDICGTIEDKWDDLIPSKSRGSSWFNSVSSALSSNDRIFASGMAIKGVPGWWALHHWEPPTPPRKLFINHPVKSKTQTPGDTEEIILSSDDGEEFKDDEKDNENENDDDVNMVNVMESENDQYEDLIVDESDEIEAESEPPNNPKSNEIDTNNIDFEVQGPIVPSADLKQQLLERLLMMDSSLLQNAIKKAKAKKMAQIDGNPKKKSKTDDLNLSLSLSTSGQSDSSSVNNQTLQGSSVSGIPIAIPPECLQCLEEMSLGLTKRLTSVPVIRASPYENDLLKKCNRVDYQTFRTVARLRRKLLVRRQRRKANLALFDLDNWMYLFLKTPESALLIEQSSEQNHPENVVVEKGGKSDKPIEFSNNFDSQSIPYIADPSKSLYVKLTGMSAIYGTCPYPITSPFTGKILSEFISEDSGFEINIPKLNLLRHLKSFEIETAQDHLDIDSRPLLKPTITKDSTLPVLSNNLNIKYTNLRKEFIGQLNDLLSESFWPGIDVSEALEYPDYAIIALVGLSVIGCAICNPDGYLSYLYVRPDFQGSHLATRLLSILLPLLTNKKDITLHVSVGNNSAMMLYQKIGFKPEEYIINFYDKYIGIVGQDTSIDNKNAFFMRLKR